MIVDVLSFFNKKERCPLCDRTMTEEKHTLILNCEDGETEITMCQHCANIMTHIDKTVRTKYGDDDEPV